MTTIIGDEAQQDRSAGSLSIWPWVTTPEHVSEMEDVTFSPSYSASPTARTMIPEVSIITTTTKSMIDFLNPPMPTPPPPPHMPACIELQTCQTPSIHPPAYIVAPASTPYSVQSTLAPLTNSPPRDPELIRGAAYHHHFPTIDSTPIINATSSIVEQTVDRPTTTSVVLELPRLSQFEPRVWNTSGGQQSPPPSSSSSHGTLSSIIGKTHSTDHDNQSHCLPRIANNNSGNHTHSVNCDDARGVTRDDGEELLFTEQTSITSGYQHQFDEQQLQQQQQQQHFLPTLADTTLSGLKRGGGMPILPSNYAITYDPINVGEEVGVSAKMERLEVDLITSTHQWDIKDIKLPRPMSFDQYDLWPTGHCRRVYAQACERARRHQSGWAMRNTNNHNPQVLKKSCLGVLECSISCSDHPGRVISLRPAICDKARKKQTSRGCITPGCSGRLVLRHCRGHSGYPVTHFWRFANGAIYFEAKGDHDHSRPSLKTFGLSENFSALNRELPVSPISSKTNGSSGMMTTSRRSTGYPTRKAFIDEELWANQVLTTKVTEDPLIYANGDAMMRELMNDSWKTLTLPKQGKDMKKHSTSVAKFPKISRKKEELDLTELWGQRSTTKRPRRGRRRRFSPSNFFSGSESIGQTQESTTTTAMTNPAYPIDPLPPVISTTIVDDLNVTGGEEGLVANGSTIPTTTSTIHSAINNGTMQWDYANIEAGQFYPHLPTLSYYPQVVPDQLDPSTAPLWFPMDAAVPFATEHEDAQSQYQTTGVPLPPPNSHMMGFANFDSTLSHKYYTYGGLELTENVNTTVSIHPDTDSQLPLRPVTSHLLEPSSCSSPISSSSQQSPCPWTSSTSSLSGSSSSRATSFVQTPTTGHVAVIPADGSSLSEQNDVGSYYYYNNGQYYYYQQQQQQQQHQQQQHDEEQVPRGVPGVTVDISHQQPEMEDTGMLPHLHTRLPRNESEEELAIHGWPMDWNQSGQRDNGLYESHPTTHWLTAYTNTPTSSTTSLPMEPQWLQQSANPSFDPYTIPDTTTTTTTTSSFCDPATTRNDGINLVFNNPPSNSVTCSNIVEQSMPPHQSSTTSGLFKWSPETSAFSQCRIGTTIDEFDASQGKLLQNSTNDSMPTSSTVDMTPLRLDDTWVPSTEWVTMTRPTDSWPILSTVEDVHSGLMGTGSHGDNNVPMDPGVGGFSSIIDANFPFLPVTTTTTAPLIEASLPLPVVMDPFYI